MKSMTQMRIGCLRIIRMNDKKADDMRIGARPPLYKLKTIPQESYFGIRFFYIVLSLGYKIVIAKT